MSFCVCREINPASILYNSIAGRYRPVSYPDGPITTRYRFIKNACWKTNINTLTEKTMPNLELRMVEKYTFHIVVYCLFAGIDYGQLLTCQRFYMEL